MKCAFYEREITPPLGCNLPGYFNIRNASDVKDKLYAKAVVISDGKEKVAIIEVDACFISTEQRDRIAKRIQKYTDIKNDNICLGANHSHTAVPDTYETGDETADDSSVGYLDFFERVVADCVILADKRLEDTDIYYGKGNVSGISFCRNYYMKSSTPRTNPGRLNPDIDRPVTEIDDELPVIIFKDSNNKPMGAIISFACHQDCVDGTEYSGDFSSELAKEFKKLYGEDFVSLFVMGASGNINHFNVNTKEDEKDHYRNMGRIIFGEAVKVIANASPLKEDKVSAKYEIINIDKVYISPEEIAKAEHIVKTVKEIPGVKIAADGTDPDQYALAMAKRLLNVAAQDPYIVPLQVIKIGEITIFTYPGEIFCQFGKEIKKNFENCVVATLCNGYVGYIPTEDMLYDTIYEARLGSFHFCDNAGDIMTKKLIEMGKI